MWDYPKSAAHQAAIDAMKPALDIAAAKAMAAQSKLQRARDAEAALKEREDEKIATRAKTVRLRAERLVREAEDQARKSSESAMPVTTPILGSSETSSQQTKRP